MSKIDFELSYMLRKIGESDLKVDNDVIELARNIILACVTGKGEKSPSKKELYYLFNEAEDWPKLYIDSCIGKLCRTGILERLETGEFKTSNRYLEEQKKAKDQAKEAGIFESIDEITNKIIEEAKIPDDSHDADIILSDNKKLIQYLQYIVQLETDIYSLKKRYNLLSDELLVTIIDGSSEVTAIGNEYDIKIARIKTAIEELKKKIDKGPEKLEMHSELPEKPVMKTFTLMKPAEPIYQKAGLFNKSKVMKENEELKQAYEEKARKYEAALSEYEIEKEKYNQAIIDYEREVETITEYDKYYAEQVNKSKVEEFNKNKELWIKKIEEKNGALQEINSIGKEEYISKELATAKYYSRRIKIEQEREYIIALITKFAEAQAKLYSYGIIYGKYRNFVAISSFCDYFLSGRCNALDGPEGAYNLYEQESRSDIIIGKLDEIVDSLEKIKDNQYYIYNEIQTANKALDIINAQLLINNALDVAQIKRLDQIVANTEQTVCNTAVAAYYSKKNTELTNSLGFLVALK